MKLTISLLLASLPVLAQDGFFFGSNYTPTTAGWNIISQSSSKCASTTLSTCTITGFNVPSNAKLLVITAYTFGSPVVGSITETAGNTFNGPSGIQLQVPNCGGCVGALFFSVPTMFSGSDSITVTVAGAPYMLVIAAAFTGSRSPVYAGTYSSATTYNQYDMAVDDVDTNLYQSIIGSNFNNTPSSTPSDWRIQNCSNSASSTPISCLVTSLHNDSLILSIAMLGGSATGPLAVNSSMSIVDSTIYGSSIVGGGLAWKDQAAAGAITPSWSLGTMTNPFGTMTVFFY